MVLGPGLHRNQVATSPDMGLLRSVFSKHYMKNDRKVNTINKLGERLHTRAKIMVEDSFASLLLEQ
jgi:hypothetical protein